MLWVLPCLSAAPLLTLTWQWPWSTFLQWLVHVVAINWIVLLPVISVACYCLACPDVTACDLAWRIPLECYSSPTHFQFCCQYCSHILPGVKHGRGVTLTTHPHLAPRSWMTLPLRFQRCVVGLLYLLSYCSHILMYFGSNGVEYEDVCLLGCCTLLSGTNLKTFKRCFLPPSSGRWVWVSPWWWKP
jgi:hypothetical protein